MAPTTAAPPALTVAASAAAAAKGGKEADARDIVCDNTAEWTRAENLTASLLRQRDHADPDEVFHPLPNQRTCELKDIFSAPRRRDRAQGSGDWTPAAEEAVQPAQQAAKADVGQGVHAVEEVDHGVTFIRGSPDLLQSSPSSFFCAHQFLGQRRDDLIFLFEPGLQLLNLQRSHIRLGWPAR